MRTVVVHEESVAGTMFRVKRVMEEKIIRFPTESTEEFHLRELQNVYYRAYGPHSKEVFDRITTKYIKKFNSINTSNGQKKIFSQLYLSKKIYDLARKSFNLLSQTSCNLLATCYQAAERICDQANDEQYANPDIYPNQKKMKRAKKAATQSARRFIRAVVKFFQENPDKLYKLPVTSICHFLEHYNTRELSKYGGIISRRGWLDISIANIIHKKYYKHKTDWQNFVSKYTKFTDDVCQLIAEYISETALDLQGKKFADFYDGEVVPGIIEVII